MQLAGERRINEALDFMDTNTHQNEAASASCAPAAGYARGVEIAKLVKRMTEEETREGIAMNLRHSREILESISQAISSERWAEAQECIILLNWKVGTLNVELTSMQRHSDQAQRPAE